MKKSFVLILIVVFLMASAVGLFALIGRADTVDFAGRSYSLESVSETFSEKTFAFSAEDGSRVTGKSDLSTGGMVVTYTSPEGEASSVLTGKIIRKNGKFEEASFQPDASKNVGNAISEPEAKRFVLAVAKREARQDYAYKALIYWVLAAGVMLYGAFTLGKPGNRAKWLPAALMLGGSLVVVALFADLLFM